MGFYFSKSEIEKNGFQDIVRQLRLASSSKKNCGVKAQELTELLPYLYKFAPDDQAVKNMKLLHSKFVRISNAAGESSCFEPDIAALYTSVYEKVESILYDWVIETGIQA